MPITDERLTEIARDRIRIAMDHLVSEEGLDEALWPEQGIPADAYERLEAAIRHEARYADGSHVLDDEPLIPPMPLDELERICADSRAASGSQTEPDRA